MAEEAGADTLAGTVRGSAAAAKSNLKASTTITDRELISGGTPLQEEAVEVGAGMKTASSKCVEI